MHVILSSLRRFFQSFAPIFTPPFSGLWCVVTLYFFWAFLVAPNSPILRGVLTDTDDYMYLTQVMDWLSGQGWFDNVQARLDPPAGVPIHFSRLTQMPMAGMILLFQSFGLPMRGAAILTALLEPVFLFACLLLAMRWLAVCFVPRAWAGVTAFIVLFAYQLMYQFAPGHVDHHGLMSIITTLTLGCVVRVMENPLRVRMAALGGFLLALGMVVALEVLPALLIISSLFGLWSVVRGGVASRAFMAYGAALFAGSVLGLIVTRAPHAWWEMDILAYSVVYVFLALGIAVSGMAAGLVGNASRALRLTVAGVFALGSAALFLRAFPALWSGPYGGLDPAVASMLLGEMSETKTLVGAGRSFYAFVTCILGSVFALVISIFILRHRWRTQGWAFGLIAALLLVATLLACFYQRRFNGLAELASIIPLTIFLVGGYRWCAENLAGRSKVFAEIGLLLLVGPLPYVLLPALYDGRTLNTGVLLFPSFASSNICDTAYLEGALNDPKGLGNRSRLIINSMGMGPEILFRTNHRVLSAPYHMNVEGNVDATRFFTTTDVKEAEEIARRRKADLVLMCRFVPDLYMRKKFDEPGIEKPGNRYPHMVEMLMMNKQPSWLERVDNGRQGYALFRVVLDK